MATRLTKLTRCWVHSKREPIDYYSLGSSDNKSIYLTETFTPDCKDRPKRRPRFWLLLAFGLAVNAKLRESLVRFLLPSAMRDAVRSIHSWEVCFQDLFLGL